MPEPAMLVAVNVVHTFRQGPSRRTAIDKRPVAGPVAVGELGLAGDTQCDTRSHGGPDKALYAYASEDGAWWAAELDREITPGLFGENLTTERLDCNGALIGERWRIGDVVVEVRMPRTPCENFAARMGIPGFHKRFLAVGRVGAYLKVLAPGTVTAGDPVTVEFRPDHGVSVADWLVRRTADAARRLIDSGIDLAEPVRRVADRLAAAPG
jgi:MOSC domain-containing protein YiiM